MGFKKRKNGGFTLVEMLVVAAILMILLAFGFVEIVRQSRYLKVTEMDNMARSIYLAAENRAVALAKNGRLTGESLADAGGESLDNLYYIKSPGADLGALIPVGAIDPTLRDASFYIVYDVAAGCVKDVFYDAKVSDENFTAAFSFADYGLSGSSGFEPFYRFWSRTDADTSRTTRANNKIYIGHYGGKSVAPPPIPGLAPEVPIELKPVIKIVNGEELKLYVTYASQMDPKINGWELEVKLKYGSKTVTLPVNEGVYEGIQPWGSDTCTWTLDALGEDRPHFKDLVWKKPDGNYMNDAEKAAAGVASLDGVFEVTAKMVEKADGFLGERANLIATPAIQRKANGLFADASNNSSNRAIIANLRHLQNLDESFSGKLNKTEAIQIANIDADKLKDNDGNVVKQNYQFKPISNSKLKVYRSSLVKKNSVREYYCSIENLTVTSGSMGTSPGAGLFAKIEGASDSDKFKFENICLINASIDGGNKPAGSIVGTASYADFKNCFVYWDDTAKLEKDGKIEYKILSSKKAGGLAGELYGGTITMSFAATTIQGNGMIGGLVGYAEDVDIAKAYADCYLHGESGNLRAGGLIGSASGTAKLTNVYSTGFIEYTNTTDESAVAGFCATGSLTVENAYSGVYYQAVGGYGGVLAGGKELAWAPNINKENVNKDDSPGKNCYAAWGEGSSSGYEGIKNSKIIDKLNNVSEPAFESKNNSANSFPYRLGKNAGLESYEVPGIKGLPHYGDWANGNQGGLPIVWIVNGEELQVKIQKKDSGTTPSAFVKPRVKLCYGDKEVDIGASYISYEGFTVISSTETAVVWTVTLDSLNGPHFWNWWHGKPSAPSSFGGDFSVRASADGSTWTKDSAKSSGNSLFASGTVTMQDEKPLSISGKSTAYIENLRHLKNLDTDFSKVDGKTAAVQTADIDAKGNAGYNFIPIKNTGYTKLLSYSAQMKVDDKGAVIQGQYVKIDNLTVTSAGDAGLFAEVSDESPVPFKFNNVNIGTVNVTSSKNAGALVGTANGDVEFNNCKTGATTVSGDIAGGLVGYAMGSVTFDGRCAVGSITDGEVRGIITGVAAAGGLVGKVKAASGISNFTMAAGAITATGGAAGGLVGAADGKLAFNNCKVVGTISNDKYDISIQASGSAGGLVGNASGGADFNGCQVYWEKRDDGFRSSVAYRIIGQNAGGLAGQMKGGDIVSSFAATFVSGSSNAGGLVGSVTETASITYSYADCYLKGGSAGNVGGLIGSVGAGKAASLTNVYSAGFIDCRDAAATAGLCAAGEVAAENAYAAMYYTNVGTERPKPLGGGLQADGSRYYVAYKDVSYDGAEGGGLTYSGMAGTKIDGFSEKPAASHPYNLTASSGKLADYHLPGLNLPHYGDWKVDLPDVEIENGDTLKVTVTTVKGYSPVVVLAYDGKWLDISGKGVQTDEVWTLPLDGLDEQSVLHFKDCASWGQWKDDAGKDVDPPGAFGGDFEIKASYEGEAFWTVEKSNSLFADGTVDGTAKIASARHLQNLDAEFSLVKGITAAEQTVDIDVSGRSFEPIVNDELRSYDGGNKTIFNLTVESPRNLGDGTDSKKGAGLFARVTGTTEQPFAFRSVTIANVTVGEGGTVASGDVILAGALAGEAVGGNVIVDSCRVTGQVKGNIAGGLIGKVRAVSENNVSGGVVSFKGCRIGTLTVSGGTAGGLVGWIGDKDGATPALNVTIEECKVEWNNVDKTKIIGRQYAGGFVGGIHGSILFKNCEAAAGGYEISVLEPTGGVRGKYFGIVTGGIATYVPETESNNIP